MSQKFYRGHQVEILKDGLKGVVFGSSLELLWDFKGSKEYEVGVLKKGKIFEKERWFKEEDLCLLKKQDLKKGTDLILEYLSKKEENKIKTGKWENKEITTLLIHLGEKDFDSIYLNRSKRAIQAKTKELEKKYNKKYRNERRDKVEKAIKIFNKELIPCYNTTTFNPKEETFSFYFKNNGSGSFNSGYVTCVLREFSYLDIDTHFNKHLQQEIYDYFKLHNLTDLLFDSAKEYMQEYLEIKL